MGGSICCLKFWELTMTYIYIYIHTHGKIMGGSFLLFKIVGIDHDLQVQVTKHRVTEGMRDHRILRHGNLQPMIVTNQAFCEQNNSLILRLDVFVIRIMVRF